MNSYDPSTSAEFVSSSNQDLFIGINVEGPEGLSNFDNIASINQLTAIFLGLFDISKSLGIPGQISIPMFCLYLETILRSPTGTISLSEV